MSTFRGFPDETMHFLAGLSHHNEREWFAAHKADFERFVVEPALALITDLDPLVRAISPRYRGVAKKVGGSLMRIYRDTRFSRDKTPYKTNIGIQFRHEFAADVHAPGWYVHLDLQECFVGAGTWRPEPEDLKKIRLAIAERPEAYQAAVEVAAKATGLIPAGESVKRMPRDFDAEHPLAAEIRRKDFLLSSNLTHAQFGQPALVSVLESHFRASVPYMAFLCAALDAGF